MNAESHADMVNIVDRKLTEIFKAHLTKFESEEKQEELNMLNELKLVNKKIDALTDILLKLNIQQPAGATLPGLNDQQGRSTTNKPAPKTPKKTEIFIPTIDTNDMNMTVSDKKSKKSQPLNSNMQSSLDALSKLK